MGPHEGLSGDLFSSCLALMAYVMQPALPDTGTNYQGFPMRSLTLCKMLDSCARTNIQLAWTAAVCGLSQACAATVTASVEFCKKWLTFLAVVSDPQEAALRALSVQTSYSSTF